MDQSDKILQAISKLENKLDDSFRMINQRLDNIENVKLHEIEKVIKETNTGTKTRTPVGGGTGHFSALHSMDPFHILKYTAFGRMNENPFY